MADTLIIVNEFKSMAHTQKEPTATEDAQDAISYSGAIVYVVLGCLISTIAYFIDHARGFAFAVVPMVTTILVLRELNISIKTRPVLYLFWMLLACTNFMIVQMYILESYQQIAPGIDSK
ncbi:MAG: hypothetical protein C9356_15305 [Oleiphilus sp.]|nr:MAG: hypothetical protein C9356_15305 [Oleiphilus sp.]